MGHSYGRLAGSALKILSGTASLPIPVLGGIESGPQVEASELDRRLTAAAG